MSKPYVVCHMMASLDGRIDCAMTEHLGSKAYYEALSLLSCDVLIEGKATAVMHYAAPGGFSGGDETKAVDGDFYRTGDCASWHAVTDTKGELLWPDDTEANRLCIVSSEATRGYLDYLKSRKVSYIVAGGKTIDLARALEILAREFGAMRVMVGGGGHINGSFLKDGLIDEVSMIFGAGIDGRSSFVSSFEGIPSGHDKPYALKLMQVLNMAEDTVWLRYQVQKGRQ